jgi:hypothetical protein
MLLYFSNILLLFPQNYLHGAKYHPLKSFPLKIHDTELRQGTETLKNKQAVT